MSTEAIAGHIQYFADYAGSAPFMVLLFIFLFMTIESSFIPFPSEVVMIPAGFLVYRFPLPTGLHFLDLAIVFLVGLAGSMAGAYINYYLSSWLGRPFLHRYGKYFFLKPQAIDRAEEIFRKYGDLATFVCRLLPAIRQLISIPAGLSRMKLWRFSLFTALGAGIWTAILAGIGYYFGHISADMSYLDMVVRGKNLIRDHYIWILAGLAAFVVVYLLIQRAVMRGGGAGKTESPAS